MSEIRIQLSDAVELGELLTFLADRVSSRQEHALADSLTAYIGHAAPGVDELHADLHRFHSCSASATANNSSGSPARDQNNPS